MNTTMHQTAPYPGELDALIEELDYRSDRGWRIWLTDKERDPGSSGLTLVVQRCGPDTYDSANIIAVSHYFPVPPATYNRRSWQRWLFNRLGDVDTHERAEDFVIAGHRPYAPLHGPGNDPYLITELATDEERRTSSWGDLNPESP